jgi:hypothetical protein
MMVRRCDACRWSAQLTTGHRVCLHGEVNVPTPAFLSGSHQVARSCLLERGVRQAPCGPAGRLWEPRGAAQAGPVV